MTQKPQEHVPTSCAEAFDAHKAGFLRTQAEHPELHLMPPHGPTFKAGWNAYAKLRFSNEHELYSDSDPVKPDAICDSNGQVVLGLCKVCGQAEGDLEPTCPSKRTLEPVQNDCLPRINQRVRIHLSSRDAWVEHKVVGYYVWPPLKPGNGWRVFVRVVDDAGYENARLLEDVRWEGMPVTKPKD